MISDVTSSGSHAGASRLPKTKELEIEDVGEPYTEGSVSRTSQSFILGLSKG